MPTDQQENLHQTKRVIKVVHFREKCIGCGVCTAMAPKDWFIDDDGMATLKGSTQKKDEVYVGEIEQQNYDENKDAANMCPMGIIKID